MRKRILVAILFVLFIWVALSASYNIYNMVLVNKSRVKMLIASEIDRLLNVDAEIKDIRFGLIDNVTLIDLRLKRDSEACIVSADADQVIIRYNLWALVSKFISSVKQGNYQGNYLEGINFPRSVIVKEGRFCWSEKNTDLEIRRDRIYGLARLFSPDDVRIRVSSKATERADEYLFGKVNLLDGSFNLSMNFSQAAEETGGYSLVINGRLTKETAAQEPQLDLFIRTKNKYLQSEFNATGSSRTPYLEGRFNLLNRIILPFRAEALIDQGIIISFNDGSRDSKVKIIAKVLKSDFDLSLKLKHLNFKNVDVVTELNLSGRIETKDDLGLVVEGEISSRNSILDYKPFKELNASYQINNEVLEILSLKMDNNLVLSGSVSLKPPYLADLNLTARFDSLDELNPPFPIAKGLLTAQGIEGEFKIAGPIKNPDVKGRLKAGSGFLKGLGDYQKISVNLEGKGKILKVIDSKLYHQEGSLTIGGEINLASEDIFADLKLGVGEGIVVWKDWKVIGDKKSSEVKLSKDIGDEFRINFKTYLNDKKALSGDDNNQIELEYELDDAESIKMQIKKDESFLAVEHTYQF